MEWNVKNSSKVSDGAKPLHWKMANESLDQFLVCGDAFLFRPGRKRNVQAVVNSSASIYNGLAST